MITSTTCSSCTQTLSHNNDQRINEQVTLAFIDESVHTIQRYLQKHGKTFKVEGKQQCYLAAHHFLKKQPISYTPQFLHIDKEGRIEKVQSLEKLLGK